MSGMCPTCGEPSWLCPHVQSYEQEENEVQLGKIILNRKRGMILFTAGEHSVEVNPQMLIHAEPHTFHRVLGSQLAQLLEKLMIDDNKK